MPTASGPLHSVVAADATTGVAVPIAQYPATLISNAPHQVQQHAVPQVMCYPNPAQHQWFHQTAHQQP
ncbi:unnamed protein product, partial [Amoebophrya sp. A25]|eukprot:GSA25T00013604001.1